MADLATKTVIGRTSAATGVPEAVTMDQLAADLMANATAKAAIVNGSITPASLTYAAAQGWDVAAAGVATLTLTGNTAFAASTNQVNGKTYILIIKQDATGSRTAAWNAVFKWPGGTLPTLSTAASSVDIFTFVSDGTNMYGVAQKAFA